MREKAEANNQDLLVIDTGDRIEGNGLYDASEPKGKYLFDIFQQQHIDLICVGNHELYHQNSSENEYNITVPNFKDNYLASNLDILIPGSNKRVPLAPRFKKFTTKKQGIRILAFGFIFDFQGNDKNTFVQPVEETVEEDWFQEAIRDREVDLFVVIGHVPARSPEYEAIFRTIRKERWDTPIQFFAGHLHRREFKKYDDKAYALASGRFMETIGFQSIQGISTPGNIQPAASLQFSRKYIDSNLNSFQHHTGLNSTTFPTEKGRKVSDEIAKARKALSLDGTYGCAEQDFWMSRAKYPSNSSIFSWMDEQVLRDLVVDQSRANSSRLAMINTGGIRFDIFKGPFTRDSAFIVSPFTNGFRYLKDVPFEKATKLIEILNSNGQVMESMNPKLKASGLGIIDPHKDLTQLFKAERSHYDQVPLAAKPNLTPGYTTKDDAGSDGDDTEHAPITFYSVPNVIQSRIDPPSQIGDPQTVDVVYIAFIEPWVLLAFKFLDLDYSLKDTDVYMEGQNLTGLLIKWVKENWADNC